MTEETLNSASEAVETTVDGTDVPLSVEDSLATMAAEEVATQADPIELPTELNPGILEPNIPVKEGATAIRTTLKNVKTQVLAFKEAVKNLEVRDMEDRGEVMANLTLAYRHLEDARMRMGKVIQATEGGVNPFDG